MEDPGVKPTQKLVVIGGGEHARVVMDAARSQLDVWSLAGFVDPQPCPETRERFGLAQWVRDEDAFARIGDCWFVLGIGQIHATKLRRRLVEQYQTMGARWATLVHVSACVSATAKLAEGAVVFARAVINTGAMLGRHAVVNTGAIVEHDVRFGEFAMVGPGAVIGGGADIGAEAYLGLGCCIRDHVRVGSGSTVGMGAVVVNAVPDRVRVMGVPAKAE